MAIRSTLHKHKKRILIATALLALISTVLFLGLYISREQPKALLACTDNPDLLQRLDASLRPYSEGSMNNMDQNLVPEIQEQLGWEGDYNCVYPVAVTQVHFSRAADVSRNLETLKQLEASGQTLADQYMYRVSVQELESALAFQKSLIIDERGFLVEPTNE